MAEPDDSSELLPTQPWSHSPTSPSPITPGEAAAARGSGWQAPEPEQLQASFPQYEIRGVLGRGGMGAVYQGWQKSLDRLVAIKILPPGLEDHGANFAERFQREAKAMARFSHPGIVAVYDAGETPDGLFYFVMEYIEGTDVQKMVRENGPLPPEHALAIAAHVCDALAYAHKRGVIHRDIKPANVMVDAEGQVKVADFGLAKVANDDSAALVTGSNVSMGTMDFMAPEALYGMSAVDHRADLYAVGVMLYQMLTGEVPRGLFEMPSKHRSGIDPRFDEIVKRAMQRDPEKRYASATDIRTDLDKIFSEPVPHRSDEAERTAATEPREATGPSPVENRALPAVEAQDLPASPAAPIATAPKTRRRFPGSGLGGRTRVWLSSAIVAALCAIVGGTLWYSGNDRSLIAEPVERFGGQNDPPSIALQTTAAPDPTSVRTFAGHRYQFVPGAVTWEEAKAKAEGMRGHLATITSAAEAAWIYATFGAQLDSSMRASSLWLGGTTAASGQPWKWVTGEPFEFSDWNKGEPDYTTVKGLPARGPFGISIKNHGKPGWFDDPVDRQNSNAGFLVEWDDAGGAPTAPLSLQPLPSESWKPLLTKDEWRPTWRKTAESPEGLLHVTSAIKRPQPAADGAIRARIHYFGAANDYPGLLVRGAPDGLEYRFYWDTARNAVFLGCWNDTDNRDRRSVLLGKSEWGEAIAIGEARVLELRIQGTRLLASVDGVVCFDVSDERLKEAGTWGVRSSDGWYQFVEVQSLPPAAPPAAKDSAATTKDAPFINSLGMKLVSVPIAPITQDSSTGFSVILAPAP